MKSITIKIGTNVLTGEDRLLDMASMQAIVEQVVALKKQGIQVVLVSSGSVAAGRAHLRGRKAHANPIEERQLLAAVGQVRLIEAYSRLLDKAGYACAQVLATKEDFRDRQHYLCMRACLEGLLHDDILPICNENDVVAVSELMFTDNDELAGLIAAMLDVDALCILTSVDGLYDRSPSDPEAKLIPTVAPGETSVNRVAPKGADLSEGGRGGMHTKCRVATKLSGLGIATHIFNGARPEALGEIVAGGRCPGTTFLPGKRASTIKKWIAHAEGQVAGKAQINACAVDRLRGEVAVSLLPVGVDAVSGGFEKGDVISIVGPEGEELGYGIAQYGQERAESYLGQKNKKALIHYDYLYLRRQ